MTSLNSQHIQAAEKHLSHPKYRPEIDGLRALAVLAVVVFHAFPLKLAGGFIGVDIFFVISGYLISSIILDSLKNDSFSFSEFYKKRIYRIFPALIIVLVFCLTLGYFILFADELKQVGKHVFGGSIFISNILFWNESGYFDTSAEVKPLLHLWSLGIEEQFYLIWPLTVFAAWKMRFNIIWVIVSSIAASFALNIYLVASDQPFTFYMLPSRGWELLAGAALAYSTVKNPKNIKFSEATLADNVLNWIGLGLLIFGILTFSKNLAFPGWPALIPVIGAVLIIKSGPSAWANRTILSNKILVWFGLISYPLYLWHWPLLTFARLIQDGAPPAWVRIFALLISIVLAWATYRFVETPIRQRRLRISVSALILMMITLGITGAVIYSKDGLPNRTTMKSYTKVYAQFVGPIWKYTNNETCLNRYPFEESKKYGWWFCMTNRDAAPEILLIGNSYANHLYPGFTQNEALSKMTILSIGDCPIGIDTVTDEPYEGLSPCAGNRAKEQEDLIFSIIENNNSVKYVLINGFLNKMDEGYISRIEKRVERLTKHNIKVVIFLPHLTFGRDIKSCFSRLSNKINKDCTASADIRESLDNDFRPLVDKISSKHPDVLFFDQNNMICNAKTCSMILDGMPIFRDEYNHYSEFASKRLSLLFTEWAKTNIPELLEN